MSGWCTEKVKKKKKIYMCPRALAGHPEEPKKESTRSLKMPLPLLKQHVLGCVMWLEAGCLQCAVSCHVVDSLTGFSSAERTFHARQTANQIL